LCYNIIISQTLFYDYSVTHLVITSNIKTRSNQKASTKDKLDMVSPDKLSGYFYDTGDGVKREIMLVKQIGKPIVRSNPKWYPMEKKIEACTLYAVYGNVTETSNLSKVPENVIRSWMKDSWWDDIIHQIYVEQNDKLGSQITSVLEKSLPALLDRLENGDYHVTKTGDIVRKPMDAKVLTGLFQTMAVQRRLVRGEPTSIVGNKQTVDDKLEKLAEEFKRFAAAKEIEVVPSLKEIENV